MKKFLCVLVCAVFVATARAQQDSSWDNTGVRVALKLYDDCSKADAFSPCLKKKAITFLDRLSRMEKLSISEGVTVMKANSAEATPEPIITEDQLENTLPRSADAKDEALNQMLLNKVSNFIGSRTVEITMPKFSVADLGLEEGRGKKGGGMKGMMGGMMMGMAAKMAALIPVAIAGLFLLAGKALITAKIALLLSGIIAIKKLFSGKGGSGGGGGGQGGWQSGGGGGGGWQASGGGWDKRSIDEAQNLAYNAYSPK